MSTFLERLKKILEERKSKPSAKTISGGQAALNSFQGVPPPLIGGGPAPSQLALNALIQQTQNAAAFASSQLTIQQLQHPRSVDHLSEAETELRFGKKVLEAVRVFLEYHGETEEPMETFHSGATNLWWVGVDEEDPLYEFTTERLARASRDRDSMLFMLSDILKGIHDVPGFKPKVAAVPSGASARWTPPS